jgi:hypothetical protein
MSTQRRSRPWWRPIVDGIDKRVTPPAERLVRTTALADTVAILTRLEVRLRRQFERQSTWLLHQYNLPTAGDIRRVRSQLAAVEARLRDVTERLEDQQRDAERARSGGDARSGTARKARSGDGGQAG